MTHHLPARLQEVLTKLHQMALDSQADAHRAEHAKLASGYAEVMDTIEAEKVAIRQQHVDRVMKGTMGRLLRVRLAMGWNKWAEMYRVQRMEAWALVLRAFGVPRSVSKASHGKYFFKQFLTCC